MALYVSSHYKNSPNDLLLMSDAPAHHLFVLLGPVSTSSNELPEILCAVQVCWGCLPLYWEMGCRIAGAGIYSNILPGLL